MQDEQGVVVAVLQAVNKMESASGDGEPSNQAELHPKLHLNLHTEAGSLSARTLDTAALISSARSVMSTVSVATTAPVAPPASARYLHSAGAGAATRPETPAAFSSVAPVFTQTDEQALIAVADFAVGVLARLSLHAQVVSEYMW